jgi:glycosyltransferase involved in cell wall biosynthesis
MRLGRLLGLPYSVALHGYDIFQSPANLREKVERAAFAVTPSEYSTRHVRELVGAEHRERVHTLVVGIDPERFQRKRRHTSGRTVLGVGRLVEKKGFAQLVDAVALAGGEVERALIVGDGPLRADLEERIRDRGVGDVVELLGPREPGEVRELLEEAAVVAVPCVLASDGDRDTMPVVAKEALAMEVPVVASDEVGLPEVVRPEWGRLVPPGDARALAEAIAELLRLSPEQRAELGRAGREFVRERCNLFSETARLSALMGARS